jgi:hypothetical protein
MLRTIGSNLLDCTKVPDKLDTLQDFYNWIKVVRASIKDNVNMINTIVANDDEKTKDQELKV